MLVPECNRGLNLQQKLSLFPDNIGMHKNAVALVTNYANDFMNMHRGAFVSLETYQTISEQLYILHWCLLNPEQEEIVELDLTERQTAK